MTQIHLVDRLATAQIQAPDKNHVELQIITIARQPQMAIFQHPNSQIVFSAFSLGARPKLNFACGIKETAWDRIRSSVEFSIYVGAQRLFTTTLYPQKDRAHRVWMPFTIDLAAFENKSIELTLKTTVLTNASNVYAWAAWGNPILVHEPAQPRTIPLRSDAHHHIFWITPTALGSEYLGCYGNTIVKTPAIDQLAEDSTRFATAWAQSNTSPGSYTSFLTGKYVPQHGVDDEWSPFPNHQMSLPLVLQSQDYHTMLLASEKEIDDPRAGFSRAFQEVSACRANPSQDGELTVRRFGDWLERRPNKPCFCWIELFDTHPPVLLRDTFQTLYYDGDPTRKVHEPEKIKQIFGTESLKTLVAYLPFIEQGTMPHGLIRRLRDTARALSDPEFNGPDLAIHMPHFPAEARNNLSMQDFCKWLELEVARPKPSRELIGWINKLIPHLERLDVEITGWLRDVKDFDYPTSQYLSAVTYVDHLVGRLIDHLKQHGIYEQSTIILTSPHGEIMDEQGTIFDHHMPIPTVLKIPMLIKLSKAYGSGGQAIDGVFDSIDLFPTLLDLLEIPAIFNLSGQSRLQNILNGQAIPAHDSFSTNLNSSLDTLYHPPFLYVRARGQYVSNLPTWFLQAGEDRLFNLNELEMVDRRSDFPEVTVTLSQRMSQWLRQNGVS